MDLWTREKHSTYVYNVQMQNADTAFRQMEWKTDCNDAYNGSVKKHEIAQMLTKTSHTCMNAMSEWAVERKKK